uniref:Uncharacterized protein n=1 Tax=Strix occidentalis caurina TaxID=311401 RepID=A0A8D0FV30_STROC
RPTGPSRALPCPGIRGPGGRAPFRCTPMGADGCLLTARPYNLDTQHPLIFRGGNGTLFGYSVLLHGHGEERWLVAGAPRASWPANSSVANPGAIFRCRIGRNPRGRCEQLQLGESAAGCGGEVSGVPPPGAGTARARLP